MLDARKFKTRDDALILADWLDEKGHEGVAERVRHLAGGIKDGYLFVRPCLDGTRKGIEIETHIRIEGNGFDSEKIRLF